MEPVQKGVTIPLNLRFQYRAKVTSISAYIKKSSGSVVFQQYRSYGFCLGILNPECTFQVVDECNIALVATGWQQVK